MLIGLTIAAVITTCLCLVFLGLFLKSRAQCRNLRTELKRFDEIADTEKYTDDLKDQAESAKEETAQAQATLVQLSEKIETQNGEIASQESQIAEQQRKMTESATMLGSYENLDEIKKQIEKQKQQVNQYNKVLGNFKTADQLKAHIAQQTKRVHQLKQTVGKFDTIAQMDTHISGQQSQIATREARVKDLDEVLAGANTAGELHARIQYQENLLAQLQSEIQQVEETAQMQEFGFYRPRYDFETSSDYQIMLDSTRDSQKQMIKNEAAVIWGKQWVVEGSEAKGRKMMKEQSKLMLRAFNGECDAATAKVKYNNATNMESRLNRSWQQINTLGKTNSAGITDGFLTLKLQELHLVHEHRVKKQEEKEEQQRIKEQMREEEKVRKETEKVQQEAEKQETVTLRALEKARLDFERATKSQQQITQQTKAHNDALAAQVAKLEAELQQAIDRKAKAIARAQLTKSGHVYVLSNIGSFGENVYKIGMTRRLEPLERVKELGDASVPFRFDVHAMIYSENAPDLENKLHQHFAHRRVNLINLRREYFHTSLEEIIDAVTDNFGTVTFTTTPQADEYRQTMALRKEEPISESAYPESQRVPTVQSVAARIK